MLAGHGCNLYGTQLIASDWIQECVNSLANTYNIIIQRKVHIWVQLRIIWGFGKPNYYNNYYNSTQVYYFKIITFN